MAGTDFDMRDLDILLYEAYQVGDEVIITDSYAGRPGELRVIEGFTEIAYGRLVGRHGLKPGIYANRAVPILGQRLLGGTTTADATKFEPRDRKKHEQRIEELIAARNRGEQIKPFLRDLPETPFWEFDQVRVVGGVYAKDEPWESRVSSIDYKRLDEKVMKGTPCPVYQLNDGSGPCGSVEDLELVERGNVWRLHHGEPLVFEGLAEEAEFAIAMGEVEEVENPNTGKRQWTEDELLAALEAGTIDSFRHEEALCFTDRDLGERCREPAMEKLTTVAA